jgi:hypothetical protein
MQCNYGESNFAGKAIRCLLGIVLAIRRSFTLPALVIVLTVQAHAGFAAQAGAQNLQDDLLFARSLRAHFLPDLAEEFLEHLSTPAAGSWKSALAVERSRARREYAFKAGTSLASILLNLARRELEAGLQNADAKPLEPYLRFELARLAAAEGHLLLEQHHRGGPNQSTAEMKLVRGKLREAAQLLQACTVPAVSDDASQLAVNEGEFAGHLALERGRNALDLAQAHSGLDMVTERGAAIRLAIAQFDGLIRKGVSDPLSWEAMAWLYRCHLDNDDAKASKRALTDLLASKNKAAEGGKRLVKALRLLWLVRENDIRTQATIQAECEEWLRQYPEVHDSTEGWELRSFLAQSYFAQTATAAPKLPVTGKVRETFEKAWRSCSDVDLPERDEAGVARKRRLQVAKILYPELTTPTSAKIASPSEGWLRAELAFAAIQSAPAETTPEQRRTRWIELRGLLTRVLALPDMPGFPREAVECRQLLAYSLYLSGELALAADEGEALARKHSHAVAAAQAGNLALQALATMMTQENGQAAGAKSAPLRPRFISLAEFMLHTWQNHPQVDTTRHLYSLLLGRERRFGEALDQLDALSPGYAELPRALYQGATLALEARKENAPPPGAASYRDRAVRLLERIPSATAGNDSKSLQTIFAGKRLLAELFLQSKQWNDLDRVVDSTVGGFQDLEENSKSDLRVPLLALQLFAKSIAADRACQVGHFHEGRLALAPAVAIVRNPANAQILEDLKQREPAVLTRFLDLSIRTAVLDEQNALAKEQLELLTQLFPENPLDLLGATMQALGEQIGSLRKQGQPAKEKLEKTMANVAQFLDSLAEQQKNNARPESLLFLAESFASIEEFARAGEFASRIEPPPPDKRDDARAQQVYRSARVLFLRSLRHSKDWKQAEALLETLLATPWGPNSLDVKKERLFLLQDQGKFAGKQGAILGWNSFMMQLQPRLQDNRLKELYFDGYFQLTYCIYQNALALPDPKAKQKDLRLAANYILKLENQADPAAEPCKKRMKELLADASPLREQYESLKKEGQ